MTLVRITVAAACALCAFAAFAFTECQQTVGIDLPLKA
jgi:hypothetical protein